MKKWQGFCAYYPFVKTIEGTNRQHTHLFVPSSGQNRLNAAARVLEADPARFQLMEWWTMTFWSNMSRLASDYLSKETQDCSQAIYDAEFIKKALQDHSRLISWDSKYVRWSLLSEQEQHTWVIPSFVLFFLTLPFCTVHRRATHPFPQIWFSSPHRTEKLLWTSCGAVSRTGTTFNSPSLFRSSSPLDS